MVVQVLGWVEAGAALTHPAQCRRQDPARPAETYPHPCSGSAGGGGAVLEAITRLISTAHTGRADSRAPLNSRVVVSNGPAHRPAGRTDRGSQRKPLTGRGSGRGKRIDRGSGRGKRTDRGRNRDPGLYGKIGRRRGTPDAENRVVHVASSAPGRS